MGNYHPSSKKLFQDPSEKSTKRNRERGLRMGVGSFGGGMLRLSKQEIEMVQGGPTGNRMRGRRPKRPMVRNYVVIRLIHENNRHPALSRAVWTRDQTAS